MRSRTFSHCWRAWCGQREPGAGIDSTKMPIIGVVSETLALLAGASSGSEATARAPSPIPAIDGAGAISWLRWFAKSYSRASRALLAQRRGLRQNFCPRRGFSIGSAQNSHGFTAGAARRDAVFDAEGCGRIFGQLADSPSLRRSTRTAAPAAGRCKAFEVPARFVRAPRLHRPRGLQTFAKSSSTLHLADCFVNDVTLHQRRSEPLYAKNWNL